MANRLAQLLLILKRRAHSPMPQRASVDHCKNRCRLAPRCLGLSKKSGFKKRCCLCTHHGTGLCWHHQKLDGPQITARKPARAAVLGAGVEVRPSTVSGAGGVGTSAMRGA